MGKPSQCPVRIPQRVTAGSPIRAKDFNALVDSVRALTERGEPQRRGFHPVGVVLPFTIRIASDGGSIYAFGGTINSDTHTRETKTAPANGTWYFEAKVVINSTTGAITSTDVQWSSSESSDTTTDFFFTLGEITVTDGVPDPDTVEQYNYGPLFAFAYGGVSDKWEVGIL